MLNKYQIDYVDASIDTVDLSIDTTDVSSSVDFLLKKFQLAVKLISRLKKLLGSSPTIIFIPV